MYEQAAEDVGATLASVSEEVFTASTIASILALVSTEDDATIQAEAVEATGGTLVLTEGTELAYVTTSDTEQTTLQVNSDVKVVLFQGEGGVNATFDTPATSAGNAQGAAVVSAAAAVGTVERVVVGTAGADLITIADDKNTQVTAGDQDTVVAGSGHDTVIAAQGDSTVVGGAHTIVQAVGSDEDYVVTVEDGHALIHNDTTGVDVDITNVQYVQLEENDALIFAGDVNQAIVANLYQAVFGRTADEGGLDYWFDVTNSGSDVGYIAQLFMSSEEYTGGTGPDMTNEEFVASLYQNALGREGDEGGITYWVDALEAGGARANVAALFAEAAATSTVEVSVVGSVTVVEGIIS